MAVIWLMCATMLVAGSSVGVSFKTYDPETDLNRLSSSTEDPLLTDTPSSTSAYENPEDAVDDYEDEDDAQMYDDENDDEELQSDVYRSSHFTRRKYSHTTTETPKTGEKFWSHFRPSHSTIRFGARDEEISQEEVKKHHGRIAHEAKCRVPQARVVHVADHHPSASKSYVPSCTVIHQCSESTGCCPPDQRCGPRRTEKIEPAFYAIYEIPGVNSHHPRKALRIERLVFYNHTECECQVRSDEMPRDVVPTPDPPTSSPSTSKCQCPTPFSVRAVDGKCGCDCFDRQRDCIKYKRGKDYLNHEDRLCIEMRKCLAPSCDYGHYIRRSGRCPRKDEKHRY